MKHGFFSAPLLCFFLLLSGCSSVKCLLCGDEAKDEPTYVHHYEATKQPRVSRSLTQTWGNTGRGGAALREPAYIHVLGDGNLTKSFQEGAVGGGSSSTEDNEALLDKLPKIAASDTDKSANNAENEQQGDNKDTNAGARAATATNATTSYSYYEMQRWGRYCANGHGMDQADWDFVAKAHYTVPPTLKASCITPAFDRNDYLAAWQSFCLEKPMDGNARAIVGDSVRPSSLKGQCPALN